ncbi:MAG: outer membrane lipoprotein carrier protein LolA [Ignavibacteriaceae bacterium]
MKNIKFFKSFIVLIVILAALAGNSLQAQINADKLLSDVRKNFDRVKDYSADMLIKVDVNVIRIPDTKVRILFKAPDKMRIKSENFAMLPKAGMNFSPNDLLKGDNSIILEKEEDWNGSRIAVIKLIPLGTSTDIVLSTIWVDVNQLVVRKVESTTKTKGTFVIDLQYDKSLTEFPLPSVMTFKFDMSRQNFIPEELEGEKKPKEEKKDKKKKTEGTVKITYSGYKVNKGIADSEFIEKEKAK